jgi:uncharacterized protein (DUF1015 family)
MAKIKPFRAIRPNPFYADQLVLTKPQSESVAGDSHKPESLLPLKDLLETGARLRPETSEGQAEAYRDINGTLQSLLESNRLERDENPCLYIYEVEYPAYTQTGVWALTQLPAKGKSSIKTHELTFDDSIRRMKNYRANTGLEGSPILLTYEPDPVINRLIELTKSRQKHSSLGNSHGIHRLWKIDKPGMLKQMAEAFDSIDTVYLADGHHRLESATKLAQEQRSNGFSPFDTISSLYMATDQLRIQEYDRAVIPVEPVNKALFFQQLQENFYVREASANLPVQPRQPRKFGMYLQGEWYHLLAKRHICENRGVAGSLDAAILQEQVLGPLFGIEDPGKDPRLKCIGGGLAMDELLVFIAEHPCAVAFTICPMTVEQITEVADEEEILPPKSTWIDPKVPYGLLLQQHTLMNT